MPTPPSASPPRGGAIKPLARPEDIRAVRDILAARPRDLLLFDLATRAGLLVGDLLRLRVRDLAPLESGDPIPLPARKTPGPHAPRADETILHTFRRLTAENALTGDDYLFRSRKGAGPMDVASVSHMVRGWFRAARLTGLTGARSLRKTWEVHFRDAVSPETGPAPDDPLDALRPTRRKTLQETVYNELLSAVASGLIPPGERLFAEKIARRMNVSQMPVREALARLEAAGFLSNLPGGGSVVRELSKENIRELIRIRLDLESMAVERAAAIREDALLDRLAGINERYLAATRVYDVDQTLQVNQEFHHAIYRAARMPILFEIIEMLWTRYSPYLHIHMRETARFNLQNILNFHHGLIEAIKRRDSREASRWLRADLTNVSEAVLQMFDEVHKA